MGHSTAQALTVSLGYEDTLKYIYDFILKNGPFDVRPLSGYSWGTTNDVELRV